MGDTTSRAALMHALKEREKELDALYSLAQLFLSNTPVARILERTANILVQALQYPDCAWAAVKTPAMTVSTGAKEGVPSDTQVSVYPYSIEKQLTVTVSYYPSAGEELLLDSRERYLIESTSAFLAEMLHQKDTDTVLRESAKILQQRSEELADKHIALKEVLAQIEGEKQEIYRNQRRYIEMFVLPYLFQLEKSTSLSSTDRTCLDLLGKSLKAILSGREGRLLSRTRSLSPRETEICSLVRNGMSSKEIASFLNLAESTVERHRCTIRKKLGITRSSVNLISYLQSNE